MLDPLANVLTAIKNAEQRRLEYIDIGPISKLIIKVLEILKRENYIKDFEILAPPEEKGGKVRIYLLGKINDIGAIKPRFPVSVDQIEKYEKRFLPAVDAGILIISTSEHGLITNKEALKYKTGGILIGYVY